MTPTIGPLVLMRGALAVTVACNPLRPGGTSGSGPVTAVSGTVQATQTVAHRFTYGTAGSQNDVTVNWTRQGQPGGPQVRFYATLVSCEDFAPATASGACQILGQAGWLEGGHVASSMVVTHGRGNPEQLGEPPEFKVWVIGDSLQEADYRVAVTWRRPVEC